MSFRLVPKSVTLNDLERRNGVISANSGSFWAHCIKVHVRYLRPRVKRGRVDLRIFWT